MVLHGHETLRPALREEKYICRIYLPILSSALLICQLDIDKLTLNYQNYFKTLGRTPTMSYQRNQHPTSRAPFDLKLIFQTDIGSLHLDLNSGTVLATWSPGPTARRSQRRSWRGTDGRNCTKTKNAKVHQEKYLYPARSLNEFRRTVGSGQPPILLANTKRLLTQDRLGQGSPESCPE